MINSVKNIRLQNRKNVLMLIAKEPNLTRYDIASKLNISLMTVTNVIEDLLHFNLIGEEKCASSIGRTPTKIFLNKRNAMFLCVDLTVKTKVSYSFYRVSGEHFFSNEILFSESLYKENFLRLFEQLSKEIIREGIEVGGIGICINGVYHKESDSIRNSNINELHNSNIYKIFSKFFNCKNVVVNSYNALMVKALKENGVCLLNIDGSVTLNYLHEDVIEGYDKAFGQIGNCFVGDPIYKTTLNSIVTISSVEKYIEKLGLNYRIDEIITRYRAGDDRFGNHLNYVFGILNTSLYNLFWQLNPAKIYLNCPSTAYSEIIGEKFKEFFNLLDDGYKYIDFCQRLVIRNTDVSLVVMCENLREEYIGNLIN